QKVAKHLQAEPPPIEKYRKDVPTAVEQTLRRMLAKRPEDRFQTPAEVAVAMAELIASADSGAGRAAGSSPAARRPSDAWGGRLRTFLPQGRWRFVATIASAVLVMGAIVYFLTGQSQSTLDLLDPRAIPEGKRPPQPVAGLVAVLGKTDGPGVSAVAFSKD